MPGMSGPELQRELVRTGRNIPVIFITAHADATLRPSLLAQGAVECLFKPFTELELVQALNAAIGKS
jgi:FixJ family two-component response regulator